jgi:hypothetical protein
MIARGSKDYAKTAQLFPGDEEHEPDPGLEQDLVGKCLKHCKDHGFIMQAFRQSIKAKGFLIPGWPDACLVCLDQRVAWIEFKSSSGRLEPAQKEIKLKFSFHGHPVHKIKSFKAFLVLLSTLNLP